MRNRRMVELVIIVMLLSGATLLVASPVGAADTTKPTVTVSSPSRDQAVTSPVEIAGSASDDVGVSSVVVKITDIDTNLRLRNDGTWATSGEAFSATLAAPGAQTTAWSVPISIPACDCTLSVTSRDAAKNSSPTVSLRIGVASASPTTPPFLTILFGQSMYTTVARCTPIANALTIMDSAAELQARGLTATGSVVVGSTRASDRPCTGRVYTLSSWSDIAALRDSYGWTFVSNAVTRRNITTLSADEQYAESCGSLSALYDHGHPRAHGLFAYASNQYSTAVQTNPVSTCFSFGRRYFEGRNLNEHAGSPWFQKSTYAQGGACNDPLLPCYSSGARYFPVDALRNLTHVNGGEWVTLQFYRFVTGSGGAGRFTWDCTSTDWRAHWTSDVELYCWDDFRAVLDEIPATDVVTDPQTVAEAWGRTL